MKYAPDHFINFPTTICLLVAITCWTAPDAFAVEFDDIVITPELNPSGNSYHGYAEYRIAVTNRSPDKTHKVKLILPKDSFRFVGNRIRKITRLVVVGPSATVHVSLFQPPMEMHGHSLGVVIDSRVQAERVPLSSSQHGEYRSGHHNSSWSSSGALRRFTVFESSLRILMSRNVDTTNLHAHADQLLGPSGTSHRGSHKSYETIDLGLPVSAWSTSWLGFSRYDGAVVTGDDIRQMPPAVQSALRRYVECGGALLVLGGLELPESWELRESQKSEPLTDSVGLVNYNIGFGQCIVSTETDTGHLKSEQWREVVESWVKTATPWQIGRPIEEANRLFPVVSGGLGVPVRGLFLLMLLFAVAIGPVNLIVLSHQKRRLWMLWTAPVIRQKRCLWMLWTVPAISLLTCVAMFAYATFAEGWNQHGRTEGLTILDERIHRATTIGWTAFYASLTLGDGLHFSYDTELTPQIYDNSRYGGPPNTGTDRTIDWTQDQHLASGWMNARIPAHFMLRKSEVRRERVTVRTEANGQLKIVNGLGANILKFWLADRDGTIHTAKNILAGAEAELTPRQGLHLSETEMGAFNETLLAELRDPAIVHELDKGVITDMLIGEMQDGNALLSHYAVVSVQKPGKQWKIKNRFPGRTYTIKQIGSGTRWKVGVYGQVSPNLRGIFSSSNWIKSIEHLTTNPEQYLRPGCYIASLDAAPFIEEGLKKVNKKQYSSIVYGILAEK